MPKNYRDPIHGLISFSDQEFAIIGSPLFQRLKRVSQLSFVSEVFSGGVHNRFCHSIGVAYLAGLYAQRVFRHLEDGAREYKIQVARIAGLLHDIGHGPFSHIFDEVIYQKIYGVNNHGHDLKRLEIIVSPMIAPLVESCGVKVKDILDVWQKKDLALSAIIQGPLGADRMDFVLRDSYYTGTQHFGTISYDRIIAHAGLSVDGGSLVYNYKVMQDIYQSLFARFFMYDTVYFHKTSMAASCVAKKMLEEGVKHLRLVERTKDLNEFCRLNDYTLIGEIMMSQREELALARKYCEMIEFRRLPKLVKEANLTETEFENFQLDYDTEYVSISRPISSISYQHFEKYGIKILNNGETMSFKDAVCLDKHFARLMADIEDNQNYIKIHVFQQKK